MTRRIARPITLALGLFAAGASVALTACDDGIQPLIWANVPDTVDLYSLARTEFVDRPGAYTLAYQAPVAPGPLVLETLPSTLAFEFDFAVSEDESGAFILLPTGVFAQSNARPGILDTVATFDGLERAPRDGYITDEPVEARTDVVYVIRSRQTRSGCFYYGKMEILELDPAGIVTLRVLANINCSDRSLIPNAPVDEEEDGEGEGGG